MLAKAFQAGAPADLIDTWMEKVGISDNKRTHRGVEFSAKLEALSKLAAAWLEVPEPAHALTMDDLEARATKAGIPISQLDKWKKESRYDNGGKYASGVVFQDLQSKIAAWEKELADDTSPDTAADDGRKANESEIADLFQAMDDRFGIKKESEVLSRAKTLLNSPSNLKTLGDITKSQCEAVIKKCRSGNGGQGKLA